MNTREFTVGIEQLRFRDYISFNPMIERIKVVIKNKRPKVAGSWKNRIPTNTVPTAPIPVQTGYAVPMGNVCAAFASRNMLKITEITIPAPL